MLHEPEPDDIDDPFGPLGEPHRPNLSQSRAMRLIREQDDGALLDVILTCDGKGKEAKARALAELLDRLISREITMMALEGRIVRTEEGD